MYSLSRVAALAALITNLVLLNLSTPYDCEVCAVFHVRLAEILVLTCHNPKLSETFALVGVSACRASRRELSTAWFHSSRFLDTWLSLPPHSCLCSACTSSALQKYDHLPKVGVYGFRQRRHLEKK
jgi:hypothetical protein